MSAFILHNSFHKLIITTHIIRLLYKITRITKFSYGLVQRGHVNCSFVYGLIVFVVILFLVGHILGCRIVAYFQFALDLRVPLPWFFIIASFFIINHIYIILECYPGWLPSQTCWPSTGYFSLVWEDPLDLGSMRLGRCHCHSIHGQICGAVLRCGAVSLTCCMCHVHLFRSRRPFIIGGGLSE